MQKIMIVFPNAKINLGLWVLSKRTDGYHNISTVFYPVPWKDVLEIIPDNSQQNTINIYTYGLPLNVDKEDNIIFKAYRKLIEKFSHLPSLNVYLYKNVPVGAGLGAGSADAAFFIKACNEMFGFNLSSEEMKNVASALGADCAFFIENKPVLASEKGDVLKSIHINLSSYYLLIVYPNISVSTKEAYQNIMPFSRDKKLESLIQLPIDKWKDYLDNDFEKIVFKKYPVIEEIKQSMYKKGAIYSSMSGSGSAVFGLFKDKPEITDYKTYRYFLSIV